MKTMVLLVGLLAGCSAAGADGPPRYAFVEATTLPPTGEGIWFDEGSPLYEAQKAWGVAAKYEPAFQVRPEAEVSATCNNNDAARKDVITLGCTVFVESPVRILVKEGLDPVRMASIKLHEMGHFLFSNAQHIQSEKCAPKNSDSAFVMCTFGAMYSEPTEGDMQWALGEEVE